MMNAQIQDGDKTKSAFDNLWDPPSLEEWTGVSWIDEMDDETELFKEKLLNRMAVCGFEGDKNDINAGVQFLLKCCKEAETYISRQTLSNWLTTGKVAHITSARKNIYKLCFALKMNADQTEEFFFKAYLDRPFNYKDLFESVCFFCLKQRKPYSHVERLVQKIEKLPKAENSNPLEFTVLIRSNIQSCNREEDLIEYWLQQSTGFGVKGQTAKKEIQALLKQCYELAQKKNRKLNIKRKISSPDALLNEIYDYSARGMFNGEKLFHNSIASSAFPHLVKRNFPQRQQLQNILNGTPTDESLRKALIVLKFYAFFAEDYLRTKWTSEYGEPSEEPFDDFTSDMNELLGKCGYVKLYWRNPFDWMFGFCAKEDNPLDELQNIISEYFLENLEAKI